MFGCNNISSINFPLLLGKPLFEMCCFHMGIAQIALDTPVKGVSWSTFFRPNFFHLLFDIAKMS